MSELTKDPVRAAPGEPGPSKRRPQRVQITMPVVVRIAKADGSHAEEATETVVVNLNGGLVRLATVVERGQKVVVINTTTREKQACAVAFVGQITDGKTEVGLEFSEPSPKFWGINFPPTDWNSADRKLPSARPSSR